MSKVKIQGNASGTGVLTVTAPNTDTDRTITLPDSTDTLAVNSDVTNKLPLAGGTLTGDLEISEAHPKITYTDSDDNSYTRMYHSAGSYYVDVDHGQHVGSSMFRVSIDDTTKVRIDSDGLKFNTDTASANALDDYEEGTFTPSITATGGGSISLYPGYDTLSYTKIGRMVTIIGKLAAQSVSSPSGDLRIGSLPFTSGDYADRAGVAAPMTLSYFNGSGVSTTGYYSTAALVAEGRTYAHIIVGSSSGGDTSIADWIGAGSDLFVTVQYIT